MRRDYVLCLLAILAMAGVAAAQPTVTLTLESSQAGQSVSPGATIDWTIAVSVSAGDNEGLALISCDLVQDASNPEFLDLAPGDEGSIDTTMQNFSRPDGIANPGEGGATTGYIGVQRGTAGAMNLVQIGGGQNTFGEALPGGTGVGESCAVIGGVGQSGPQTVLSGSFSAPATGGTYTFSLTNAMANVITELNAPPAFSPVTGVQTWDLTGASFSLSVEAGIPGDLDGDGCVDLADLATLLSNYGTQQGATYEMGDIDGDGDVDVADLAELLSHYGDGCG